MIKILVIPFYFLVLEMLAILDYFRCLINGRSDGLTKSFKLSKLEWKLMVGIKSFPGKIFSESVPWISWLVWSIVCPRRKERLWYIWRHLAECPGILSPHQIELGWHSKDQGAQVGEGQVEEVDVGGRPHVLVLDDHQAGGQVAQDTQHQEQTAQFPFLA